PEGEKEREKSSAPKRFRDTSDEEEEKPAKPARTAPRIPPRPPMFIGNPNVPFDISSNHPDAISNADVFATGLSHLKPGNREWMTRRLLAELRAYVGALKVARGRLSLRGKGARRAADDAFSFISRLEKGRERIEKGTATDEEFSETIRVLITGARHLLYISNNGVEVPIPEFYERPNPEFTAWIETYGNRAPDDSTDTHSMGGGFR